MEEFPKPSSSDPRLGESSATAAPDKPRSCAVCAQRKVRCDKQFPCGRCQRAGIACVRTSTDPRPRWARRLTSPTGGNLRTSSDQPTPLGPRTDKMFDRLKLLERLVEDLRRELEQARGEPTPAVSQVDSSHSDPSPADPIDAVTTSQAGHIILDDSDRVRYVSDSFGPQIDHNIDSSEGNPRVDDDYEMASAYESVHSQSNEVAPGSEADRTPFDRHAFLLKYNLSSKHHVTSSLLPQVSHIAFILETYSERVHFVMGLPHMPSFRKLLQRRRSRVVQVSSPSEEALTFSVFYAAICSLDDEEVTEAFGVSKTELTLKYRVGLENALAKADFLNNPSDVLVQSLIIFLALARRHDSPKFIWMMVGLVLRMAKYLGFHRDGSGSEHITPFQVEMQRRIWWDLCALEIRATEDQGTEMAIPHDSYTTKIPSNLNDTDIWPEMNKLPKEREDLTNTTFLRLCSRITRSTQEMMAGGTRITVDDHNHRLSGLMQMFERDYFSKASESRDSAYLAAAGTMRIALGRLTLLAFLPKIYSSPTLSSSTEMRTKLLVAAIEVAEHNHALNCDDSCHPWKWVYQTQQHWHAVVYLLNEICRRPWSSTIERAWVAIHSPWLVPARVSLDKNFSLWVPLRRLLARAHKHRENELVRLRGDPNAAAIIEEEDRRQIPIPSSSTIFSSYFDTELFRKRWHQLIYPGPAAQVETNSHMRSITSADSEGLGEPTSSSLVSDPWLGRDAMDFTEYTNLDSFLGNGEMDSADIMSDSDFINFDWTGWFDSARGSL